MAMKLVWNILILTQMQSVGWNWTCISREGMGIMEFGIWKKSRFCIIFLLSAYTTATTKSNSVLIKFSYKINCNFRLQHYLISFYLIWICDNLQNILVNSEFFSWILLNLKIICDIGVNFGNWIPKFMPPKTCCPGVKCVCPNGN